MEEKLSNKQKQQQRELELWQKAEKQGKWAYAVKKAILFAIGLSIIMHLMNYLMKDGNTSWQYFAISASIYFILWLGISVFQYNTMEKKFSENK